ncbi:MAG: hypothetical protein LKG48_11350 [Lachnospiraceae bacterium]|nr:hypothetical protein [Lachnospiraceae bacterium]MCH4064585.1 hypothetical protein [Lachnospiraceae bacterium]MCH4104816.1 hypothetical protein [Lachnospiraceae bacterium]MCI1310340.1 hypothetical protein [Lachnospiraceae bacterium]MCI1334780.1 hypothetical protein [Lachnospiraceae bacterium]
MNNARKRWIYPQANVVRFVANDYVSACGDTGYGDYLFECNAGNTGERYDVVTDSGRLLTKDVRKGKIYYYSPCDATHKASTKDDFEMGYIYPTGGDDRLINSTGFQKQRVYIWTDGGTDVHCTTNLDRNSWIVDRS